MGKSCEPRFLGLGSHSFLFFEPFTQLFNKIIGENDLQNRTEGQYTDQKLRFVLTFIVEGNLVMILIDTFRLQLFAIKRVITC